MHAVRGVIVLILLGERLCRQRALCWGTSHVYKAGFVGYPKGKEAKPHGKHGNGWSLNVGKETSKKRE